MTEGQGQSEGREYCSVRCREEPVVRMKGLSSEVCRKGPVL